MVRVLPNPELRQEFWPNLAQPPCWPTPTGLCIPSARKPQSWSQVRSSTKELSGHSIIVLLSERVGVSQNLRNAMRICPEGEISWLDYPRPRLRTLPRPNYHDELPKRESKIGLANLWANAHKFCGWMDRAWTRCPESRPPSQL